MERMPIESNNLRAHRLASLDLLRGLVIVLMVLDHVRGFFSDAPFSPTNLACTDLFYFSTRWVTHFCAPAFVFLAGLSAGLKGRRETKRRLGGFLLTRGLWLILVEVTLVSFAFCGIGSPYPVGLAVIWAIGVSMILLAGLQCLPKEAVLAIGLLIICGHNLLDSFVLHVLHTPAMLSLGSLKIYVSYPLLPWIGVMALGFGMSALYDGPADRRRRLLALSGAAAVVLFVVLRVINGYGEPVPWSHQDRGASMTLASFLNLTKYPPSLLFLLMTLGPALVFLAFSESRRGRVVDVLTTFGRVPFFVYILHLYIIRAGVFILAACQGIPLRSVLPKFHYFPADYGVGLIGVVGMWIAVLAVLFPLCRWFDGIKRRRKKWWLSYL